jgi:predicted ABC-type ATPase
MPTLYILAGPNGAGKTTASKILLPEIFHCDFFLNADEIAVQLNPSNVEAVAMQAGRIMLQQIESNISLRQTFCIETTLATKSYLNLIKRAQLINYEVVLLFFYLPSAEMAKERVALRVSEGGHNIPTEIVERRYNMGLQNLKKFITVVDRWYIFNNSKSPAEKVAEGEFNKQIKIINFEIWERLKIIWNFL